MRNVVLVKKCITCGKVQTLREFYHTNITTARQCYSCKKAKEAKKREEQKKAARKHGQLPPISVQFVRDHPYFASILRRNNIGVVEYLERLRLQDYKCPLCGVQMDKFLYPDLNSKGKLHALLCRNCLEAVRYAHARLAIRIADYQISK